MLDIHTRGSIVSVPSCVDELNSEQYRTLLYLALSMGIDAISPAFFRVRWASYLLGFRGNTTYLILKQQHIDELTPQVATLMAGFLTERDGSAVVRLETPRNLWPEFDGHTGPGDWLAGMTYGEVVECATVLAMAQRLGSLPDESAEQIARIMYHLPADVQPPKMLLCHCVTLFQTVWNAISTGPIEINGEIIDFSIIFKDSSTERRRPDDKTGWAGVTFEVAAAGVFGSVKEVEATDFWNVLLYLYKCKFEANHSKNKP